MAIDFDSVVHEALFDTEVYGREASYSPSARLVDAGKPLIVIFDREHEVVLNDIAQSELKAAGHSTNVPVATVRLAQFAAPPQQGDTLTIAGEAFTVWDVQKDGQGCADLVLRKA